MVEVGRTERRAVPMVEALDRAERVPAPEERHDHRAAERGHVAAESRSRIARGEAQRLAALDAPAGHSLAGRDTRDGRSALARRELAGLEPLASAPRHPDAH